MFLQRIAKKASEERIVHVEAEHLNLRRWYKRTDEARRVAVRWLLMDQEVVDTVNTILRSISNNVLEIRLSMRSRK